MNFRKRKAWSLIAAVILFLTFINYLTSNTTGYFGKLQTRELTTFTDNESVSINSLSFEKIASWDDSDSECTDIFVKDGLDINSAVSESCDGAITSLL